MPFKLCFFSHSLLFVSYYIRAYNIQAVNSSSKSYRSFLRPHTSSFLSLCLPSVLPVSFCYVPLTAKIVHSSSPSEERMQVCLAEHIYAQNISANTYVSRLKTRNTKAQSGWNMFKSCLASNCHTHAKETYGRLFLILKHSTIALLQSILFHSSFEHIHLSLSNFAFASRQHRRRKLCVCVQRH